MIVKPVEGCEKKKRPEGQRILWLPSGRVAQDLRVRVFSAYQPVLGSTISLQSSILPRRMALILPLWVSVSVPSLLA